MILSELELWVAAVFYLISSILYSTAYIAEILQLATVFAVLAQLNKRIIPYDSLAKNPFLWGYSLFCAILFVLYLSILALHIQYYVQTTEAGEYSYFIYGSYSDFEQYKRLLLTANKINIAYNALYFVASLVVLGLAILTLMRSLKAQASKQKLVSSPYPEMEEEKQGCLEHSAAGFRPRKQNYHTSRNQPRLTLI